MEKVAGLWLGQLRSLLGVKEVEEGVMGLPPVAIRDWEVDYQLRYR